MKKGFTIITLVIIITITIILFTTIAINGQKLYDDIEKMNFDKKIEILEKEVKKMNFQNITIGDTINDYTTNNYSYLSMTMEEFNEILSDIEEKYSIEIERDNYYIVNTEDLISMGIKHVKGEYIVNFRSSIIFCLEPYILDDVSVYTIYDNIAITNRKQTIDLEYVPETMTGNSANTLNNSFSFSIDNDGVITINGSPRKRGFLKTSGGLNYYSDTSLFPELVTELPVLANRGDRLSQKITHISGTVTGTEFNSCFRTIDNFSVDLLKCNMCQNVYENDTIIFNDIAMAYFFFTEDVVFTDFKIKIELIKDVDINNNIGNDDSDLDENNLVLRHFMPDTAISINSVYCQINEDYTITITGSVNGNMFIKLSNGLNISPSRPKTWATQSPVVIPNNTNCRLSFEEISGSCQLGSLGQFNVALRTSTDVESNKCAKQTGVFSNEGTNSLDLTYIYIFMQNVTFQDNYTIKIKLEEI